MSGSNKYIQSINYGKGINQNINRRADPQNPLTYCIFDTMDINFLHGSSAADYKLYCIECQNYMADRCAGVFNESQNWDQMCELYLHANKDTDWPNEAAIDRKSATVKPNYRKERTVGERLIRNALERRFLVYPNSAVTIKQFDPNQPNSPFYKEVCGTASIILSRIKNINRETIDNDRLMNEGLHHFTSCSDVLARIWLGYRQGEINIAGTALQKNLDANSVLYQDIWNRIVSMEKQQIASSANIGAQISWMDSRPYPEELLRPDYQKGIPNCAVPTNIPCWHKAPNNPNVCMLNQSPNLENMKGCYNDKHSCENSR